MARPASRPTRSANLNVLVNRARRALGDPDADRHRDGRLRAGRMHGRRRRSSSTGWPAARRAADPASAVRAAACGAGAVGRAAGRGHLRRVGPRVPRARLHARPGRGAGGRGPGRARAGRPGRGRRVRRRRGRRRPAARVRRGAARPSAGRQRGTGPGRWPGSPSCAAGWPTSSASTRRRTSNSCSCSCCAGRRRHARRPRGPTGPPFGGLAFVGRDAELARLRTCSPRAAWWPWPG